MTVHLRPMASGDMEAAVAIGHSCHWGDMRKFLKFYVDHSDCFPVLAEEGDRVVGMGVASRKGKVGWLGIIAVLPESRGQGLGAALTLHLVEKLDHF